MRWEEMERIATHVCEEYEPWLYSYGWLRARDCWGSPLEPLYFIVRI